jgi:hypothetical protein
MSSAAGIARCPDCGAVLNPHETQCWLCRRPVFLEAELVAEPVQPPRVGSLQFSIQSLLLITTLIAVCLGALVSVPGLGILALIIAVPALVRTFVTGAAMKREGHKLTTTDKIMTFFASAAIAWAALAAAGVAFCATCTVTLFTGLAVGEAAGGSLPIDAALSNALLWTAIILCAAVSLAAFIGMFWITRPYIPKAR